MELLLAHALTLVGSVEPPPTASAIAAMRRYTITVTNHRFEAVVQQDAPDMESAKEAALRGALETGVEALLGGDPQFGASVVITDGDERERFLVSIATSPLK